MGRTWYCDCCGQDIKQGSQFYRVDKIPQKMISDRDLQFTGRRVSEDPYIICTDCFIKVGRMVQEQNNPVEFDIEVDKEN